VDRSRPGLRARWAVGALAAAAMSLSTTTASAATLEARTLEAYQAYVRDVLQRFAESDGRTFLWADQHPDRRRALLDGEIVVEAADGDGILNVPGGLIHHWIAAAFMKDVALEEMLEIVRSYDDYPRIHPPVVRAELISQDGETHRVFMRLEKSTRFVTAVLDTWWLTRHQRPSQDRVYTTSHAETIQQVERAGRSDERRLPPGTGGGYVWAASTVSRFLERDGGTYVEFQTLGLSRTFPRLLGWLVEPIARRIGAGSVKDTLAELRRAAAGRPPGAGSPD